MPNENASFAGRVAFVTGAANGIGRAAALAFARDGRDGRGFVVRAHGNRVPLLGRDPRSWAVPCAWDGRAREP